MVPEARTDRPEGAARGARGWLVSAPFCCGASWLVNVLLELGVRTTYVGWAGRHWLEEGEASRVTPLAWNHLRWHLAALEPERRFRFEPGLEIVWGHELVPAREPAPAVLVVRDVRDAVRSLWRRDHAAEIPLERYLARRADWPDHFPGCFGLTPPDTWALYTAFWLAAGAAMPVLTARFEALKDDPVGEIETILGHWGLARPREAIARAVELSSVERLRAAVERRARGSGWRWQTARRGQAAEWRERPEEETRALLTPLAADVMARLGYPVAPPPSPEPPGEFLHLAANVAREIAGGDAAWVLPRLRDAALAADGERAEALARCHLALRWTASVFAEGGPVPVVTAVAQAFVTLVLRHAGWPPLAEAAGEALARGDLPRSAVPPRRESWTPPATCRVEEGPRGKAEIARAAGAACGREAIADVTT